jgi:hypothetical protein
VSVKWLLPDSKLHLLTSLVNRQLEPCLNQHLLPIHCATLFVVSGLGQDVHTFRRQYRYMKKLRISCQNRKSKLDHRLRRAFARTSNLSPRSSSQRHHLQWLQTKVNQTITTMDSSTDRQCKICMVNDIDTIIAPCQHAMACTSCVKQCVQCPICRGPIQDVNKVFW